eukprot:COSAG01_NODE_14331_length_1467_cov_1.706140_1_plen_69_part_00
MQSSPLLYENTTLHLGHHQGWADAALGAVIMYRVPEALLVKAANVAVRQSLQSSCAALSLSLLIMVGS